MAWLPVRHPRKRAHAPSRRASCASHSARLRRNRRDRGWRASDVSHHQESLRPARALLPRALAIGDATIRTAWRATTTPPSRPKRIGPPVASYTGSSTLLQAEVGGVDLSAALEVHADRAATIGSKNTVDRFGVGDRRAIYLD